MTSKQLISMLALSVVLTGYADPLNGETFDEKIARLKKAKQEKVFTPVKKVEKPKIDSYTKPLTLLGKEICEQKFGPTQKMVRLYLGSSSSVTNVIAEKNMPCCTVRERFDETKIGTTMKLSRWRDALSHSRESHCMGLKSIPPETEIKRHEFRWSIVRE